MQHPEGKHDPAITDHLSAVLNAVRDTGMSAHPRPGQSISDLVLLVAMDRRCDPVALQAEVAAYPGAGTNLPTCRHMGASGQVQEDTPAEADAEPAQKDDVGTSGQVQEDARVEHQDDRPAGGSLVDETPAEADAEPAQKDDVGTSGQVQEEAR